MRAHAREVRVPEEIAGAVHAGGLAVPHAQHAVVPGLRELARELAAEDHRGAQLLVEARDEADVVLGQERGIPLEVEIEAAQRRARIPGDDGSRAKPPPPVGAMLVHRQPHQGLDAGEEDAAGLDAVLGVEREVCFRRHGALPSVSW